MQENSPEMDLRFLLHSEKRDPNPIVREQALKSGSRKRKKIVYHLLTLVIYKVLPGNGTKTAFKGRGMELDGMKSLAVPKQWIERGKH